MLPGFFRLVTDAVLPAGEATVVADGQAAALWVPPGTPAVPDEDAFGASIAELIGDDVERTFALMAMLDEIHPIEPHRFLWFVGTRPAFQGRAAARPCCATRWPAATPRVPPPISTPPASTTGACTSGTASRWSAVTPWPGRPPVWSMWRSPGRVG